MQLLKISQFKFIGLCAVATLVAGVQPSQASAPDIRLIATTSGKPASAQIKTYAGKTYISGVVYRLTNWTGTHVHIVLADARGRAFASRSTELSGWQGKPSTHQRGTYSASFDPREVAKATTVQVTVLGNLHAFCGEVPSPCES